MSNARRLINELGGEILATYKLARLNDLKWFAELLDHHTDKLMEIRDSLDEELGGNKEPKDKE